MNVDLLALMDKFISGEDTSIELANQIEVLLDDGFPEDDVIQMTVEMLAMYRPYGGDFLFDSHAITTKLRQTTAYLKRL